MRPAHVAVLLGVLVLQACASMHPSVRYRATLPAGELRILEQGETIAECGSSSTFPWEQCAELRAPAGDDLEVVWWYLGEVARSRVQSYRQKSTREETFADRFVAIDRVEIDPAARVLRAAATRGRTRAAPTPLP